MSSLKIHLIQTDLSPLEILDVLTLSIYISFCNANMPRMTLAVVS